jgi:hypothetical protein
VSKWIVQAVTNYQHVATASHGQRFPCVAPFNSGPFTQHIDSTMTRSCLCQDTSQTQCGGLGGGGERFVAIAPLLLALMLEAWCPAVMCVMEAASW